MVADYAMIPLLFSAVIFPSNSAQTLTRTASLGQNVTLPCEAPSNINILAVNWTRPDLGSKYVFLSRDGQLDPDNQHPSYENRVKLGNDSLQDGNLSLILSNVKSSDYGTYECYIKERKDGEIVTHKLNCTVNLKKPAVSDKPDVRGGEGVGASIVVILIVLGLCVAVYWIYRRRLKNLKSGHHDPENGQLNPVGPDGSMCSVSADPVLTKAYTAVRTMLINGYKYNNSKNNNL
ncbi:selection and upkeep of intraepithelial T-cells protein 8-like isoform X3 [Micropterus salmoides]|uniref:selection and upkeep of intraepithelial T-cells protein 8-like isoform X3 n=1 Tax=Micropterus salmoides TaxID=27706 RepID=UPI0018EA942F|nr:selection and upkeep of intraepithelial T-cells protein 8-like isoform X3 [Micropterus salmoides]